MAARPARGLRYDLSIPAYLATRAAGRRLPALVRAGWRLGLRLVDLPAPALPGPEWLRVCPRLCGICGSDLALLTGKSGPALTPFASFPAVLGHEIVGTAGEVGAAVAGIAPGARVVVDPFISCAVRGVAACAACRRGEPCLCTETATGPLAPGMLIGYCRDLPGGWSEEMIVHRSQVYPVPAALPDALAVLVEPLSVALHAVLKAPPAAGSRVLIAGGGPIGLCVLAALRLLGLDCPVTLLARYPAQARLAERLGADHVLPADQAGLAAVRQAGARAYRPLRGRPVYLGGFDWVYDCAGSAASLADCLRVAGPRGRVVLVGCVDAAPALELSFVWARELQVLGSYGYGREPSLPGQPHTFELALRRLADQPGHPLGEIITHRFALDEWRAALLANLERGRSGAVKTVFDCQAARPGEREADR
jgi:threonine dehydrogenase-like Zn-dependent dehydrogenase